MVEQIDWKGVSKWKLDTPCLVLDLDRLEQNIRTMPMWTEKKDIMRQTGKNNGQSGASENAD